jgi:hypothetical protein
MRSTHPIAFIGPQHYRRFQSIIGPALPANYDEWLVGHAIQKNRWDRLGFDVREIQVLPDELVRYGETHSKTPTLAMLGLLALEKINAFHVSRVLRMTLLAPVLYWAGSFRAVQEMR